MHNMAGQEECPLSPIKRSLCPITLNGLYIVTPNQQYKAKFLYMKLSISWDLYDYDTQVSHHPLSYYSRCYIMYVYQLLFSISVFEFHAQVMLKLEPAIFLPGPHLSSLFGKYSE